MNGIDMFIAVAIILIVAILIYQGFEKVNEMANVEKLINTDNSRKKELTKCCTDTKCYSKPEFMRQDCQANKEDAKKTLDTMFEQTYTQDEYFQKLNEMNIIKDKDLPTIQKEQEFVNKLNERITLDKAIGESLFDKIVTDKQDQVCGYNIRGFDTKDYAPFIPIK